MQCPNGDGELISHTTQSENDLAVSYSTCATCHGYWMESFAANFIKLPEIEDSYTEAVAPDARTCPTCNTVLKRATGDNIPDHVTVFTCPEGHGYFFPAGQLAAWKHASKAKINYFEKWHIPMPAISAILLAGITLLVFAGGYFAFTNLGTRQVTTSQASTVITNQKAYVSGETKSVIMSATTSISARLTIHIPAMNGFTAELRTSDGLAHTLFIPNITPGPHTYYYEILVGTEKTTSEIFDFTMPE